MASGTKIGDLYYEVTADTSQADKEVEGSEKKLAAAGKRIGGTAVGIGAAIGTFAGSVAPSLISAAGGFVELAKQAETFDKKANTVFAGSAGDIKAWADDVNESFGLSDEAVVGLAANMGDLLKPMGFTAEQAAELTKTNLDAAGALSAWSGGALSASDVADKLSDAMLGETDGLKALGISISAAEVEQRAMTMSGKASADQLTDTEKALATQALILEKSTDAQTAWTDGTMDSVKQQNNLKAAWEDAKVALGQKLLPIVQTATAFFVNNLIPALGGIKDAFVNAFEWVMNNKAVLAGVLAVLATGALALAAAGLAVAAGWIAAAAPFIAVGLAIAAVTAAVVYAYQNWSWFQAVVDGVVQFMVTVVWPALQAIFEWLVANVPPILQAVADAFVIYFNIVRGVVETVLGVIMALWDTFGSTIIGIVTIIWDTVSALFQSALDQIMGVFNFWKSVFTGDWQGAWDAILQIVTGVWDGIKALVSGAIDAVKLSIDTVLGLISSAWSTTWGAVSTFVSDTWTDIKDFVSTGVTDVLGFVAGIPAGIVGALGDGFGAVWNSFKDVLNKIIGAWNNLSFPSLSVGGQSLGPLGELPSFTFGGWQLPDIPTIAHSGGVIPGTGNVPALLQGGEMVLTRQQQRSLLGGGSGMNNVFNIAVNGATDYQGAYQGARAGSLAALAQYTRARTGR